MREIRGCKCSVAAMTKLSEQDPGPVSFGIHTRPHLQGAGGGMKDGPYRVPCPVARLPDCQRHTISIVDTRLEMKRTRTVRTQRGAPSPLCAVSQNRFLPDGGIL